MITEVGYYNSNVEYAVGHIVAYRDHIFKAKKNTLANMPPIYPIEENEFWIVDKSLGFQIGDRISHYNYGKGVILGNYHKRLDGKYYWHIKYDTETYGYNQESSLKLVDSNKEPYLKEMTFERKYNPSYGDDKICICGHPYYRHFDSYEDNRPVGCKYCDCYTFEENIKSI